MRKWMLWTAIVGLLSVPAAAQSAEFFGGYSYGRYDGGLNSHGWNAAISGNLSPNFGITGDFAGHYKSENGASINFHSFMAGPRVSGSMESVRPFAHALFGGTRVGAGAFGMTASDTAFSMALGGGVDVGGGAIAFRLVQADYFMTRFGGETQNNFRIGTGVVFRFGM